MKKTILILSMIVGFAASHLSFTKMTLVTGGLLAYESSKAQINTYRQNPFYSWYVTTGGLDPTTGAEIVMKMNKDTMWFLQDHFYFDSLITHSTPAASSNKMLSVTTDGHLTSTTFSNITLPYAQLTGTPNIVVYSGANGISITSGVISKTKRQETYSASTATTGIVTVTYGTAYSVTPNVQPTMGLGATNKYTCTPVTSTTTGCSYKVEVRNDVLGLLPSYTNISGLNVDFIVTEK